MYYIELVSNDLWVMEFISTTEKCVTLTDDLAIHGHLIFHMALPSGGTRHPTRVLNFYVSVSNCSPQIFILFSKEFLSTKCLDDFFAFSLFTHFDCGHIILPLG